MRKTDLLQEIKNYLDEIEIFDINNIYSKLSKYEFVSFDIFDTLIKRDTFKPTDVFYVLEKVCKINKFADLRIKAENAARRKIKKADITLNDIYACLDINYDKFILMQKECEIELDLCVRNPVIYPIYDWCRKNNKKIVIISDMYLPEEVIRQILKKNGYDKFCQLFISNVCNLTKQSGEIYEYILRKLKINGDNIIHIGNSFVADYFRARKSGFSTEKIKTTYSNMQRNYFQLVKKNNRDVRLLESFINNHTSSDDYYYKYGYECLGPALIGFTKWAFQEMKKQNRNYALFLGRDGLIMKQVYDVLGFDEIIQSGYIEVSRRCFRIPALEKNMSFEEMCNILPLRKVTTVTEFLDCMGLEPDKYARKIREFGLDDNKTYIKDSFIKSKEIEKLYDSIRNDVIQNAKEEKRGLLVYLASFDFDKRIGLIDVGWGGTIQHYLEKVLCEKGIETDILGYYWGVAKRSRKLLNPSNTPRAKGYLYDCLGGNDQYDYQHPFDGFFETMFLQQIGSVKRYKIETDNILKIERLPYEYENNKECAQLVNKIQTGALDFVREFKKSVLYDVISYDKDIMLYNLLKTATMPNKTELEKFGEIKFYDSGNMKNLVEQQSFFRSLTNPRSFMQGYFESYWKVGYLKNIFKINLPYMNICLKVLPIIRDVIYGKEEFNN